MFKDYRRLTDSCLNDTIFMTIVLLLLCLLFWVFLIVGNSVYVAPYKKQCLDSIF